MKKLIFLFILLIVGSGIIYNYYVVNPQAFKNIKIPFLKKQQSMVIKSSAFIESGTIPAKYTCEGENISPPLTFTAIPIETRSLVLIMEDPTASSSNFTHWIVFDINPNTNGIPENSIPLGATEGQNDLGELHYTGPCPPSGTHKYTFKLYALDSMLELDKGVKKQDVLSKMDRHILEETTFTAFYQKN